MRQERLEVRLDANGANTRATTAVGNTEGLVKVQVANVSTESSRRSKTNLSIHVGTVHVDLTAVLVDKIASLADTRLKDTESAGVCDHEGTKLLLVLLALGLKISKIQVTSSSVTLDGDNAHTSHGSGSRVGTVGRDRDQADIALRSGLLLVELANGSQTSKLSLSTRVGLQRGGIHAGKSSQLGRGGAEELLVSLVAAHGSMRVDVGALIVANEFHLGSTVKLHGARAERNHGVNQGQVLGLQLVDVSEHLGLAVVGVENRMSQKA